MTIAVTLGLVLINGAIAAVTLRRLVRDRVLGLALGGGFALLGLIGGSLVGAIQIAVLGELYGAALPWLGWAAGAAGVALLAQAVMEKDFLRGIGLLLMPAGLALLWGGTMIQPDLREFLLSGLYIGWVGLTMLSSFCYLMLAAGLGLRRRGWIALGYGALAWGLWVLQLTWVLAPQVRAAFEVFHGDPAPF